MRELGRPAVTYTDSVWYDEQRLTSLLIGHIDAWPSDLVQPLMDLRSSSLEGFHAFDRIRRLHARDDTMARKKSSLFGRSKQRTVVQEKYFDISSILRLRSAWT